jgi:RNA polymerase sigma factor (sigma-70 family)
MLVKYFDGKTEIEIEAAPEVVKQLADFKRQEASERRKARRHNEVSLDGMYERTKREIADSQTDIEADYIAKEEMDALADAISLLTDKQRQLIKFYYYEGKTEAEIAAIFCISQQAVNGQISTVHRTLKKYFKNF